MDRWIKCIATHGNIRGVAIQATDIVRDAAKLHGLEGVAARGLGEAMIGALLLGSYCKSGERVNLNIQGSKHYRQALIDAYPEGTVRGYVIERPLEPGDPLLSPDEGPWGQGVLSVLRTKGTEGKQPYIGTVPLLTGYLAKDLTYYWAQSEQIPSAVGLAINFEGDRIASAGGFLVQALPGADQKEVRAIEQRIQDMESLASQVARNENPTQLLSQIFQETAFVLLEETQLSWSCNCSWERVERAIALVGLQELESMLKEDGEAFVRCDFCTKEYRVSAETLRQMISKAKG